MMRICTLALTAVAVSHPWRVADAAVDAVPAVAGSSTDALPETPPLRPTTGASSAAPAGPGMPLQNGAPAPPAKPAFYGHYILMSDLAILTVVTVGVRIPETIGATFIALIPWVPIPAAIHAGNGNPWSAMASIGLRTGLPALGGFVGLKLAPENDRSGWDGSCGHAPCKYAYAGYGFLLGAIAACLADQAIVSHNSEPPGRMPSVQIPPPSRTPRQPTLEPPREPQPPRWRRPPRPSRWTMTSIAPALLTERGAFGAVLAGSY